MNTELEQRDGDGFEGVYNYMNHAVFCSTSIYWCLLCARYCLISEDNYTHIKNISVSMELIFQCGWRGRRKLIVNQ